ncbi:MAG: rhodanese-like domain-containing protein, partial [Burkholderiaceae bacterium]
LRSVCAFENLFHQQERERFMKTLKPILTVVLILAASIAFAQQAAPTASNTATSPAPAYVAPPWTYKTKQLDRAQIDALLAKPKKVVVIDVRRPDELISKGAFPAYLNIQAKEVEKYLDFIPKDRTIITVSNRAHRAGAVGDLLTSKGFKVAGAAGSLDYEDQGGTVARITPPVKTAENK